MKITINSIQKRYDEMPLDAKEMAFPFGYVEDVLSYDDRGNSFFLDCTEEMHKKFVEKVNTVEAEKKLKQDNVIAFIDQLRQNFNDGKKIEGIKTVRAFTGLGLKEAKDLVEELFVWTPKPLF